MKNKKGFTIIELLVVMVIIGILASMAIFSMTGARESARDARRQSDLQTIRSALEQYRADCRHYPPSSAFPTRGNAFSGTASCFPASVTYLQNMPGDPVDTSTNYTYTPSPGGCTTNCTTYVLCANNESENDLCSAGATHGFRVTNP